MVCNNVHSDRGCAACGGTGYFQLTVCPQTLLDDGVQDFLELYDYAQEGTWPVGGGLLDQTRAFTEAVRFMRGEEDWCKRKLRENAGE